LANDIPVSVRSLTERDLSAIATIHLSAFPNAAISGLGHETARRFYMSLLTGPHEAYALGAFFGSRLTGYCFFGVWEHAEINFLRCNAAFLLGRVALHPWLIFRSGFTSRLWLGVRLLVRSVSGHRLAPRPSFTEGSMGIQSIAVDSAIQGSGFGRALILATEDAVRERGLFRMHLSVSPDNGGAIGFYERAGWERLPLNGKWTGVMVRNLN
jgi:ribosomal protein S18 acetylase RimI-like enzyme